MILLIILQIIVLSVVVGVLDVDVFESAMQISAAAMECRKLSGTVEFL
jgi:hypothetical protein